MSAFKLPEPVINRLLDLLGNDDAFRARFTADPRAALAAIGFEPAANPLIERGIWICWPIAQLASKEVIRASHTQLRGQFTMSFDPQTPFALEARFQAQSEAA